MNWYGEVVNLLICSPFSRSSSERESEKAINGGVILCWLRRNLFFEDKIKIIVNGLNF